MSTGVTGMFGAYQLRGLLGRGGMGEVHRAYDTRRGREVALKLLTVDPGTDPTAAEWFRREARALVRLSDPNIVPVHDFGEVDGRLFIDMALIEGHDLAAVLAARGPLPAERAVHVLGQAARALDTAHRHGVVHRDVKPSNLLILADRDDFTYLVDFGIAHAVDGTGGSPLTASGTAVGTLAYVAPEQILAHRVVGRLAPDGPPSALLADAMRAATAGGGRPTLQAPGADAYTGSGFDASGAIFYFRARMSDNAVVTAFWRYPAAEKDRWDVAVTRSASSLRLD